MSTFLKTGSKVRRDGMYRCIDCENMGLSYAIKAKKGDVLPHCPKCDHDAEWQIK